MAKNGERKKEEGGGKKIEKTSRDSRVYTYGHSTSSNCISKRSSKGRVAYIRVYIRIYKLGYHSLAYYP